MHKEDIRVIIIGSGTGVPVENRSPAAIFLRAGNFSALLDIGPGSLSKLPQYRVDAVNLKHIFITHLHPDHVLDLAIFYLISDYAPERRKGQSLNIVGCEGLKNFVSRLMQLFPDISPPTFQVNIVEMANSITELENVKISSTLSGHTNNSVSFRFDFIMGSLVYTGDCVYSTKLEEFCQGADILICECSYPQGWKTNDHMTAQHVGMLAENSKVKQLIVTHLYPPALEIDLATQIAKNYSGQIIIAQDGTFATL
jgi:ribonuclease BN (tRNA processing enzyme)